jgi:NDP-sugar pyrophosphorylase family protein
MDAFPTGVILAGGLGTRLRSVLPDSAKSVAPVAGQPFLRFLLDQVRRGGAQRVILCTGYRSSQVEQEIGSHCANLEILYSPEDQPLGTGGALRQAWQRYGDSGSTGWVVMNGDSYCDIDLAEFWSEHQRAGRSATLAAIQVRDAGRFGSLVWDDSGTLLRFGEKDGGGAGWINGGIYALEPEFLNVLSPAAPLSLERDVFPRWIARGIHVVPRAARFIDIGTPESLEAAQSFFAETRS